MGDSDNPLGGIIGMVVLISVLPMILQMLSGLTGGQGGQGGQGGFVPLGGERFGVTAPTRTGGYNFYPGREYSTGAGFQTPLDLSPGYRAPGGPNTFQGMATGPGSLFDAMRGGGVNW